MNVLCTVQYSVQFVYAWQPRPLVGLRRVFLPRLEILGGDVVVAAHHEDLAADHGLALGVALAQALGHVLELARLGVPHLAGREVLVDASRYLVNLIRRLFEVLREAFNKKKPFSY